MSVHHCQVLLAEEGDHKAWYQFFFTSGTFPTGTLSLAFFSSSRYFFLNKRTVLSPKPCSKSDFLRAAELLCSAAYQPIAALCSALNVV